MGIENGVVKGDIVVTAGEPRVIELAARLSGGYFCSHEIPLNTGVDLVGCAIRQCLGEMIEPAELQPRFNRPICQRYLFPQPGRISSISGIEAAAALPGVELCEVRVQVGDLIQPINSHPARAGVLICSGENRQQAQQRAKQAVAAIRIVTEPV
jgi:biotin carboxylase